VSKFEGGGLGMAGRKPTTADQKKLAGTFRADRLKKGMEFTLISEVPPAPDYLSAPGKKYYANLCGMLIEKKMLYNSDVHLLALLAEELTTWEQANRQLKTASSKVMTTSKGYQQQSPWVGIRNVAQKNIRDIGALFGLDPLSRTRFMPSGDKEKENPFKDLI
jgi:P27 family predicted phage terminase small subunit